jgi:hypothetical protein
VSPPADFQWPNAGEIFVTYAYQIASEVPPPPSLASRIMNYINASIVADTPLNNAVTTVPPEIVHTNTSANSTVQRRSKRTRSRTRQLSNDVEPIGDEAEDHGVEFETVDASFVDQDDEVVDEMVVRSPENARMLKELECTLDGVYWGAYGPRIRCKPDVFVPAM